MCNDPPATGYIGEAAFLFDGADDLPGGFVNRRHPKTWSFGHFGVDKARLDIGDIKGDLFFAGLYMESFEVGALKRFRGAISRGVTVSAVAGDGGDGDEVAVSLLDEIIPAEMYGGEKSVDVDVYGRLVDGPVEGIGEVAPTGVKDEEVETAEALG